MPPLSFASFLVFSLLRLLLGLDFWHAINNPVGVEFEIWYQIFHMFNMELLSSHLGHSQRIAAAALVLCPLNKNNNRHNSLSLHVAHCPSVKLLTKWTSFNSHLHCATTLFRSLHLNFNQDPSAAGYKVSPSPLPVHLFFYLSRGHRF